MRKTYIYIFAAVALSGCFTGVESTPKITYSDVKKEKIVTTPEQLFLREITPQPPAQWQRGKLFHVTDPKISIIFNSGAENLNGEDLYGKDITFLSLYPMPSITGDSVTEVEFLAPTGQHLYYRDLMPYSELNTRQQLEIPFTIEESLIDQVSAKLIGNTYYVVTSLWYSADGKKSENGLRHVPILINAVEPGNNVYPLRIIFTALPDSVQHSLYMTVGNAKSATRNFHTLMAFDNPRTKHPDISDDIWELIINSKVKEGMTRDECMLALGTPLTIGQRPTTAGMVEYWSYSDGKFLLFEDGLLSSFRR